MGKIDTRVALDQQFHDTSKFHFFPFFCFFFFHRLLNYVFLALLAEFWAHRSSANSGVSSHSIGGSSHCSLHLSVCIQELITFVFMKMPSMCMYLLLKDVHFPHTYLESVKILRFFISNPGYLYD